MTNHDGYSSWKRSTRETFPFDVETGHIVLPNKSVPDSVREWLQSPVVLLPWGIRGWVEWSGVEDDCGGCFKTVSVLEEIPEKNGPRIFKLGPWPRDLGDRFQPRTRGYIFDDHGDARNRAWIASQENPIETGNLF